LDWVRNGNPPPDSRIPRIADGTLVPPDQESTGYPNIPGVTYTGRYNGSGERYFGPRVVGNSGVIDDLDPAVLSSQATCSDSPIEICADVLALHFRPAMGIGGLACSR
jgi:hypothetical protein